MSAELDAAVLLDADLCSSPPCLRDFCGRSGPFIYRSFCPVFLYLFELFLLGKSAILATIVGNEAIPPGASLALVP